MESNFKQEHSMYERVPVCPLCGGKDSRLLFIGKDLRYSIPGEFPVVSCTQCGLVRLAARPSASNLGIYYPSSQYPAYNRQNSLPLGSRIQKLISMISLCRNYDEDLAGSKNRGRMLDLGCGAGQQLNYYKESGWETFGVEISKEASRKARNSGHEVFCGTLEEANYPSDYFILIRARHVLEHLPNPVGTLIEIQRILKKNGQLVLETPNCAGLWARVFRCWYWQVDAPRHFFLFDKYTLEQAIESSNLFLNTMWTCSTPYGVDESLKLIADEVIGLPNWNHFAIRIVKIFLRIFFIFPNFLMNHMGMGENLVLLAEKCCKKT
jgi:SAM-dependent methyltransferase